MNKKVLILLSFVILFIFGAGGVKAFNAKTHQYLWQQAIKGINISMCSKTQQNYILYTAPIEPDFAKDKSSHICYVNNCPAIVKTNELIVKAQKLAKQSIGVAGKNNFCQEMIILGNASHYLADAKNPVHQRSESAKCHSDFEAKVWELIILKKQNSFNLKCNVSNWVLLAQNFSFSKSNVNKIVLDIKSKIVASVK